MSGGRWRPIPIRSCSAVGAFGIGIEAFCTWWEAGHPQLSGPITTLDEPWLPTDRACEVPSWKAREHLPDRKAIKLMTRRVQLGLAAALEAWGKPEESTLPPPHRRAMYTGCSVPTDEDWTFRLPIEESIEGGAFDMHRFATHGQEFLNPLWLVKSLTNNVLAFGSKTMDLQGTNNNFEGDAASALVAVAEAARALADGRADVALAGAGDSLVSVESLLNVARHGGVPQIPGEGASFVRMDRGTLGPPARAGGLAVLGFGSAMAPDSGALACSMDPPPDIIDAIATARNLAWEEAAPFVSDTFPALRLLGPRLPPTEGDIPELRPSDFLGDCAAAGGALLVASAWAESLQSDALGPYELVAAGPSGEVAVLVLGTDFDGSLDVEEV